MNRGWVGFNLSGRKNSTVSSEHAAPGNARTAERIRAGDESAVSSSQSPYSVGVSGDSTLNEYVEAVLKGKEVCLLAIAVEKVDNGGGRIKLRQLKGGTDTRILAVCKQHQTYALHKLYPNPTTKLSRTWLVADITEIVVKPGQVADDRSEFSITFSERTFDFRATNSVLCNEFIWKLMQTCLEVTGKAPSLHGVKIMTLQRDASEAIRLQNHAQLQSNALNPTPGETNNLTLESPEENPSGQLVAAVEEGSKRSNTSLTEKNGLSGHGVESLDSEVLPGYAENEDEDKPAGKKNDENTPITREKLEQKLSVEAKQADNEWLEEEVLKLQLSSEQLEDLFMTLEEFDVGGSNSGMYFSEQLESEMRKLESANMIDLIHLEKEQFAVCRSLDELQEELIGAEVWLKECSVRLSSSSAVIRDIEKKLKSLEVQMGNAKALDDITEKILTSVVLTRFEVDMIESVTGSNEGNRLDDDDYVLFTAKEPLQSLVDKLNFEPTLRELKEIKLLSDGREQIVQNGQIVLNKVEEALRKRLLTATTDDQQTKDMGLGLHPNNLGSMGSKSVEAFSLLSALMMSTRPSVVTDIISLHETRAGAECQDFLEKMLQQLAPEPSIIKALDFLMERLTPFCRNKTQGAHALFDATAEVADKDREAFVGKIIQSQFASIPQFLDDLVYARSISSGMKVYLQSVFWMNRQQKEKAGTCSGALVRSDKVSANLGGVRALEESPLEQYFLRAFVERCRDRLKQHADELVTVSATAANAALTWAASVARGEIVSKTYSSASVKPSPFGDFFNENLSILKICSELMSISVSEGEESGFGLATSLVVQLVEGIIGNLELAAPDDSTRSLVVQAENLQSIHVVLGDVKVGRIQDLVKVAVQGEHRASARCVDRVLRNALANILDSCTANKSELADKVSEALAEVRDETALAKSVLHPLEEFMSPGSRKAFLPVLLKEISAAANQRLTRVANFLASEGLSTEEQAVQSLRRRLDGALMKMRLSKEKR